VVQQVEKEAAADAPRVLGCQWGTDLLSRSDPDRVAEGFRRATMVRRAGCAVLPCVTRAIGGLQMKSEYPNHASARPSGGEWRCPRRAAWCAPRRGGFRLPRGSKRGLRAITCRVRQRRGMVAPENALPWAARAGPYAGAVRARHREHSGRRTNGVFSPDMREFYFTRLVEKIDTLHVITFADGKWGVARELLLLSGAQKRGQTLHFVLEAPAPAPALRVGPWRASCGRSMRGRTTM